jgi:hypothetical protein
MFTKSKNLSRKAKFSILIVIALYTGAMLLLSARAAVVGDINNDGTVNIFDLSQLLSKWNTTDDSADLNNDNAVNIFDLSILLSKWGQTSTPPPSPPPPPPSPSIPANTCTNPVFQTSNTNGGRDFNGYYVHNNMWNANSGETLYACSEKSWYVDATGYTGTAVKTYPNVHLDLPNAFTTGVPFSNYSAITSNFGGKGPGKGIYNVAYDLWLNGVGWGGGSTEVMIWTEYIQQRPLGSIKSNTTIGGVTYDVWHYNDGDANVVSFVARGNQYTGTLDLKAIINYGISKNYIPANPSLNQFGYGIEFCDTAGTARFYVTDFSVTLTR